MDGSCLAQFRARKAKGRSRKILVRWSTAGSTDPATCVEQSFRLVQCYNFGNLLHDALVHFGLAKPPPSADDSPRTSAAAQPHFELRDAEGSVWPLLALIEDELSEDDFLHTSEQSGGDAGGAWPVVYLVETGLLGRRSVAKASKKKSHETRSAGKADSDEGTNGSERKKKGSKVRRAHSETPVVGLPTTLPLTPSAVSSLLSTAGDEQQPSSSAAAKSSSSESERRRLSTSQPGMAKRHSSETLYKGPSATPVQQQQQQLLPVGGTTAALQPLDLDHVDKNRKRVELQPEGEVSPDREGSRSSPRRSKDQQGTAQQEKEERRREKASSGVGTEPDMTSPRRRQQPSPREKSESEEQCESEGGGGSTTPKKSSTTGKLYAEITRGVRTHLRAASDTLSRDHHDRAPPSSSSSPDDRETSEKTSDHGREAPPKEKRDKKDKHDKKENVIVRLFSQGERHHKDKSAAVNSGTSNSGGSSAKAGAATTSLVVPMAREEVEIQITGPRGDMDADSRVMIVHGAAGGCDVVLTPSVAPSPPMSPFPMHKSGIRLVKVDSEHCINLPLINSEITAQKTSSKATKLLWEKPPSVVLIIKKPRDPVITQQLCSVANWLEKEKKMTVLVEPEVQKREAPHLTSFTQFLEDVPLSNKVDFIITLGGDGTILHVNSLFPYSVPPVVSFALGSLGFLTPFDVAEFEHHLTCVIRGEFCLTVRQRLEAQIFKLSPTGEFVGSPAYQCMNEVVIDRGPDSHLCSLECYCDGLLITTIQADGVIISSTTGSTAYSLSAGGTMCHPIVPAVCFTPICPHSLSCRPIMFPDSVTLRIQVPEDARTRGWVSFDGRTRTELNSREYVVIKISRWPIPCINKTDHIGDWFRSLCECLNWNNRQKQKAFPPPT